jgi:DHA1 family tetracycline resistance protein-like MFS transporter
MNAQERRVSFFTVLFSEFIDYTGISLVYPLFAYMLFDPALHFLPSSAPDGVRGFWLGILIALHPLLQFLCAPIFGALSDQKGRKKFLQLTMGLCFFGYALACLACLYQSLILLAFFRICVGIAAGNCSVISAIVADLSSPESKAKHYGLLNMAFGAGFTLGPCLSGVLASRIHLSAPFFMALFFVALNWVLVSWKLKETGPSFTEGKIGLFASLAQIKRAAMMKELRFLFLALLIFSFGWSFFTEFASLYLMEHFHFSPDTVGFYYAYNGLFYAFSAGFLITPFIRWLKIEKILFFSMLLSGIYLGLFIWIERPQQLWAYLPVLQFFLSFVYPAICTAISNRVSEKRQGEIMGMYQGVIALALAITPFCGGVFAGGTPVLIIVVSAFCMVLAATVQLFLKDKIAILDAD